MTEHWHGAGVALRAGADPVLYLRDPDQNGVELYWDRPREEWPVSAEGDLEMFTRAMDLGNLLKE